MPWLLLPSWHLPNWSAFSEASSESILVFLPGLEDEAQNRQCEQAIAS